MPIGVLHVLTFLHPSLLRDPTVQVDVALRLASFQYRTKALYSKKTSHSHQAVVHASRSGARIGGIGDGDTVLEDLVALHLSLEGDSIGDLAEAEVDDTALARIVTIDHTLNSAIVFAIVLLLAICQALQCHSLPV